MLQERDGHRAAFVYLCSLSYVGAHGCDGFVTREALPFIHGRVVDAERLVRHGFWWKQPGGWLINGWTEFQASDEETRVRRVRAQSGAAARWEGHEAVSAAERTRRWRASRHGDAANNGQGA
jgi:hypothetical protein